jgi:integrase
MRDDWALRGYKATNDRLQVLKNALKTATRDKPIKSDPFEGVDDMARPHDLELGNLPWEDAEVEAAIAWRLGRKLPGLARAIGLGRRAGFRRGTICRIPLGARRKAQNARRESEQRLNWITEKRKVLCDKREDPRLTALIEATPNRALTIAYSQDGNPWKERQLNQALDRMLADLAKRELARPQLTLHGLRHAHGEELAATGASDAEIMAQLEQSTEHSARIYRRRASRRRMADAAQDRIDGSNVIPLSAAPQTTGTPQERGSVKRL